MATLENQFQQVPTMLEIQFQEKWKVIIDNAEMLNSISKREYQFPQTE